MIVHYFTASGQVLLIRPQTVPPAAGDLVTLEADDGSGARTYRVTYPRHWYLHIPVGSRSYYSLTDAPDEHVHVILLRAEYAGTPAPRTTLAHLPACLTDDLNDTAGCHPGCPVRAAAEKDTPC